MVKYAQNELYSITDFTKQIGSVVNNIKEHTLEKIGILKNNKLEAVVVSTDEYERLKAIEEKFDLIEHSNIYNSIQDRKNTSMDDYISMDEMAKKFNIAIIKQIKG